MIGNLLIGPCGFNPTGATMDAADVIAAYANKKDCNSAIGNCDYNLWTNMSHTQVLYPHHDPTYGTKMWNGYNKNVCLSGSTIVQYTAHCKSIGNSLKPSGIFMSIKYIIVGYDFTTTGNGYFYNHTYQYYYGKCIEVIGQTFDHKPQPCFGNC